MRRLLRGGQSFVADPAAQVLTTLTLGLIAVGAVFYRLVEGFSWLDSVYFTVITLATVGYGDLAPATAAGKVFTMFYVVVGIGILVAFVTKLSGHLIAASARGGDQ